MISEVNFHASFRQIESKSLLRIMTYNYTQLHPRLRIKVKRKFTILSIFTIFYIFLRSLNISKRVLNEFIISIHYAEQPHVGFTLADHAAKKAAARNEAVNCEKDF